MESFKDKFSSIKIIYAILVLLFLLNIFTLFKVQNTNNGSIDSSIAKWVNDNPETMLRAINDFAIKQQEELIKQQQAQASENITKFEKDLKDTKYAGVINPKGTKEIVIFYDYNCGYCKIASKNINELLKTRKDVKVILRSIPILSQASRYASEVGTAILISNPEKYPQYHEKLMNGSARSKEEVNKAVESIGLKMARIDKILDKNKEEIETAINNNLELASKIGVNGTPAFVINGELIPGAVDTQTLDEKIGK